MAKLGQWLILPLLVGCLETRYEDGDFRDIIAYNVTDQGADLTVRWSTEKVNATRVTVYIPPNADTRVTIFTELGNPVGMRAKAILEDGREICAFECEHVELAEKLRYVFAFDTETIGYIE